MQDFSVRCCGEWESSSSVADRQALGERRRVVLHRVVLAVAVTLCSTAVAVSLLDEVETAVAQRLFWASTVCMAGLVGGWIRQAMTTHRPEWRLMVAVGALAIGLWWQPLVPALTAVLALAEHMIRRVPASAPGSPQLPVAKVSPRQTADTSS